MSSITTMKAAYEWAATQPISRYNTHSDFAALNIRQLKALAQKFNAEMGLVICKSCFGKTLSAMRKAELINAMVSIRSVQRRCPRGATWEHEQMSPRIWSSTPLGLPEMERAWVHYLSFECEQRAFKFHTEMNRRGLVELISLRKGTERTNFAPWEVKCWGLCDAALYKLLLKDSRPPAPIEPPKEEVSMPTPTISQHTDEEAAVIQKFQFAVNALIKNRSVSVGLEALKKTMRQAGYELDAYNKVQKLVEF